MDSDPSIPKATRAVPQKYTEDYMRQIVMAVNGAPAGCLPPREMIKEAQDYFHMGAAELKETLEIIKVSIRNCDSADRAMMEELNREFFALRREIREAYMVAAEMAFKNLPYFHAKIIPTDAAGTAASPLDALLLMLREIDELSRGRPTWMKPDLKLVGSS